MKKEYPEAVKSVQVRDAGRTGPPNPSISVFGGWAGLAKTTSKVGSGCSENDSGSNILPLANMSFGRR